jgi:hypothetical protein
MDEGAIDICADPVSAVRAALDNARPGDLLVLLALSQREEVLAQLAAFIDRRTVPKTPTA